MPRMLKTLYPCKRCGVPTQVRRKREAEFTSCSLCSVIGSYAGGADYHAKKGREMYRKLNGSQESELLLSMLMVPIVAEYTSAAADGLVVAMLTLRSPSDRAGWVRWAHAKLEFAEDLSKQLRELTSADRHGFTLIQGGLEPIPEGAAP